LGELQEIPGPTALIGVSLRMAIAAVVLCAGPVSSKHPTTPRAFSETSSRPLGGGRPSSRRRPPFQEGTVGCSSEPELRHVGVGPFWGTMRRSGFLFHLLAPSKTLFRNPARAIPPGYRPATRI